MQCRSIRENATDRPHVRGPSRVGSDQGGQGRPEAARRGSLDGPDQLRQPPWTRKPPRGFLTAQQRYQPPRLSAPRSTEEARTFSGGVASLSGGAVVSG